MTLPKDFFKKIPLPKVTEPPKGTLGQVSFFRNCWWPLTKDEEILVYTLGGASSPQCNSNEKLTKKMFDQGVWSDVAEVRQIPMVFLPHSCE